MGRSGILEARHVRVETSPQQPPASIVEAAHCISTVGAHGLSPENRYTSPFDATNGQAQQVHHLYLGKDLRLDTPQTITWQRQAPGHSHRNPQLIRQRAKRWMCCVRQGQVVLARMRKLIFTLWLNSKDFSEASGAIVSLREQQLS